MCFYFLDSCVDEDELCPAWASDNGCNVAANPLLKMCRKSCDNCGPCADQHPSCKIWADDGHCYKAPSYMWRNCKASCYVCPQGTSCDWLYDSVTVFIVWWRNRSSISILHLQSHEFDLRFRLGKPLHPETRKLQYVCCKLSNMLDSSWLSGFLSTTWRKLFKQLRTSLQISSCMKSDFQRLEATGWSKKTCCNMMANFHHATEIHWHQICSVSGCLGEELNGQRWTKSRFMGFHQSDTIERDTWNSCQCFSCCFVQALTHHLRQRNHLVLRQKSHHNQKPNQPNLWPPNQQLTHRQNQSTEVTIAYFRTVLRH